MREMTVNNAVIGSGAAGLSAVLRLLRSGERDTVLLTENMNAGTSRNTGSDKQTYYKLSLSGGDPDSVKAMAEDLFAGGAVDGDLALCEAALSTRGFYNLVELGVPFPCNEYGEYMGYKTDHDRGRRATSAGPYTSRLMTEALEAAVRETGVRILDGMQAIRLLTADGRIYGVLCLDRDERAQERYLLVWAQNVILATGGPAGLYRDSVYPPLQLGASGMAFAAGAAGKNLTEWQFGMASVKPRWNVSGTYMQVLPRFISTDRDGGDEREFLAEYFSDEGEMLSMVFLKGYQWPFDVNKIFGGSSVIDLLVYRETILRGRRVFLDFRTNPGDRPIPFDRLGKEAETYLKKAGALFGTPFERLMHMNQPAVSFYADHGVDLGTQPLEIAICAQHNNGGLSTDADWETDVKGLFAIGELCGSHGVTRPGGSALNAGQAGAIRAADAIRHRNLWKEEREENAAPAEGLMTALRKEAEHYAGMAGRACGDRRASDLFKELAAQMSAAGGMIRQRDAIAAALKVSNDYLTQYESIVSRPSERELSLFYRLYDTLLCRRMYLGAMLEYIEHGAGSRGSALYTDPAGEKPAGDLPELYRCSPDRGRSSKEVQEIRLDMGGAENAPGEMCITWRPVRPVPEPDDFFENQWKAFRRRNRL